MPPTRGTSPRLTKRQRNCAKWRPTATRSSSPASKPRRRLLLNRDRLPRALTNCLAHVRLVLRGDFFLQHGQHVVVAEMEYLRINAHADAVAFTKVPIDFDFHRNTLTGTFFQPRTFCMRTRWQPVQSTSKRGMKSSSFSSAMAL